jgi:hypothetical protein
LRRFLRRPPPASSFDIRHSHRYFPVMNAAAIIDEIKQLPPVEQEQVVVFVQSLKTPRPWSGAKLTEYERRMLETDDPVEAQRLKEQIVAGFYGDATDA